VESDRVNPRKKSSQEVPSARGADDDRAEDTREIGRGQFALDLNYGPHLRLPVDNFVIAGPGAQKGVDRCFAVHGKRYDAVIRSVCQYQDECSLAAVGSGSLGCRAGLRLR
jgi:alpha-glutamyl/putrescinyl thymine pyrophosphorylase clade 1